MCEAPNDIFDQNNLVDLVAQLTLVRESRGVNVQRLRDVLEYLSAAENAAFIFALVTLAEVLCRKPGAQWGRV